MAEHPYEADYEMDEVLEATSPEQFKAFGDATRQRIIALLRERAATTKQLSEALGQPVGGVGHHLKVLERAGLIRVVRTRQVRAITEKYYGRVARIFRFAEPFGRHGVGPFAVLEQAIDQAVPGPVEGSEVLPAFLLEDARLTDAQAEGFARRLLEVMEEFASMETPGERLWGFVAGVYPTNIPGLPPDEEPSETPSEDGPADEPAGSEGESG